MFSDRQIEALSHGCAGCGKGFTDGTFCVTSYRVSDIRPFFSQVELGIIGAGVRNIWLHLDCDEVNLRSWNMQPDIHVCIRCKSHLGRTDVVQPVFQVVNPDAINPDDPTDKGVELGDRIYFVHVDCKNTALNQSSSNILIL